MKTKKIIVFALIICTIALIMGACKQDDGDDFIFKNEPYYNITAPKYTKYAVGSTFPEKDHKIDLSDFSVVMHDEFHITDRCLLLWPDGAALGYYSSIGSGYRGTQSISIFYRTDFIGSFNVSVFTPEDIQGKWRRDGTVNVIMTIDDKDIDITGSDIASENKAFTVDAWEARRDESYNYNDSSNFVGFYGNDKSNNISGTFIILSDRYPGPNIGESVGNIKLLYNNQIWQRIF